MKSKITYIAALDTLFLFFLIASSFIKNPYIGDLLYYTAFILPIGIGIYLIKQDKTVPKNAEKLITVEFGIKKERAIGMIPFVFPIIAAVCLISYTTSLVMHGFGIENTVEINESFPLALLIHAFLPALLEEILFRYVPINLMSDEPKCAVVISSLFFAAAHANLFSIPYAAFAGLAFALIDIATESIIPSLTVHFLNNFVSLILIFGEQDAAVYITLCALALISSLIIVIRRKSYSYIAAPLTEKRQGYITASAMLFIAAGFILAILNL